MIGFLISGPATRDCAWAPAVYKKMKWCIFGSTSRQSMTVKHVTKLDCPQLKEWSRKGNEGPRRTVTDMQNSAKSENAEIYAYFPELMHLESYAHEACTRNFSMPLSNKSESQLPNPITPNAKYQLRCVDGRLQVVGFSRACDVQKRRAAKNFRSRSSIWREVMYYVTK